MIWRLKNERILALQNELEDRTNWALRMSQEIAEKDARILALQSELDDRTAWAFRLRDEIEQKDQFILKLQAELQRTENLLRDFQARLSGAKGVS